MFKKNTSNADIKKSQQKCIDVKRDLLTRLKHLKAIFENGEYADTKLFIESNYSIIFQLFFDSFMNSEANLRQKGAFAVQRSYREDLEYCLFILDRILCLLPDLIKKKWQCNALTHIFKKLLHQGNTLRLKGEAMRLFILWYMIIGDQKTPDMDCMFASLVHGFPVPPPPVHEVDASLSKVMSAEISLLIPSSNTEKIPDDLSSYMLRSLLEFMVSQTRRVEWKEQKALMCSKSFSYIFMMFRSIYLPYIFPNFNPRSSVYKPSLDLPELRTTPGINHFGSCPVVLVEWVKKYITPLKKLDPAQPKREEDRRKSAHVESHELGSDQDSITSAYYSSDDSAAVEDHKLVHDILLLSRENVNFIHELFRQALRLCFRYSSAMKAVIQCYCDWIKLTNSELPSFMLEPKDGDLEGDSMRRLRNDSYIGAIDSDLLVRAGLQNILQFFVTSACNVFLLVVSPDYPRLLDEQVELCKLILNIYRYMVMNTRMEQQTWEQLLLVLFHVTSQTLKGKLIKHKDSLGRRFASALFQTLIVSCIKANLSVVISGELWNQLLTTLVSLTHWEELIKEWAKTMDTLTKVLARHVYGLELDNLPLDRLTERNALKRAATKITGSESSRNTLSRVLDNSKFNMTRSAHSIIGTAISTAYSSSHPHNNLSGRLPDDASYSKHNYEQSPFNQAKRRNSLGSISSQKCSGASDCSYGRSNSESYTYDQHSHAYYGQQGSYYPLHYSHRQQHREGYYRHYGPSRYKMFRSASDPNLIKNTFEGCRGPIRRHVLSQSLNYIPFGSDEFSRSASPAPSSGLETSSLKESPLQMDIGGDTVSLDTLDGDLCTEQRSVMAGGTVRGWLPDVSVILWRRVLGLLGDPNDVGSPQIHEQIFKHLLELTEKLIKLRNNQGISVDNQTTPEPPDLVPPILLLAPWCFKSLTLPDQFNNGKILAYQILCKMMVRKQDMNISVDLLAHFYRVLHQGLVGSNQVVISTLVGGCSPYFFSLGLPGSSMLALDFIYATNTVISSNDPKLLSSRFDALSLLGSLYPIASLYPTMPVLQPSPSDFVLIECTEVKDHLINVLMKCAKRDSYSKTRSLALCALSVYLYHELSIEEQVHPKVTEAINVLLASLKPSPSTHSSKSHFHTSTEIGRLVSQISSDMLLLLADLSDTLLLKFPDVPAKIVQVLCQTLSSISVDTTIANGKEGQFLILSLLFCLGEWVMRLPQSILTQPSFSNKPILHHVFKMLHIVATGVKPSNTMPMKNQNTLDTADIDLIVKEEAEITGPELSGSKGGTLRKNNGTNTSFSHSTVKLAARTLTNHIVNHLWHFPLCVGAQRLSSMVVENDDLPGVSSDELTSDIFHSNHVQLFALNNSCLMSLIQLPSLQVPGGASTVGFKTPTSEVRLILRDLSGKFSWDASTLYAPPSEDCIDCNHEDRESQSPIEFEEDDSTSVPISPKLCTAQKSGSQIDVGVHSVTTTTTRSNQDQSEQTVHFITNSSHRSSREQTDAVLHGTPNVSTDMSRDEMTSSIMITAPPRHTLRHRQLGVLPSVDDSADDLDNIDDLLSYIGYTSPEVLEQFGQPLNEVVSPPGSILNEIQTEAITAILNQRNSEHEHLLRHADDPSMVCPPEHCPIAIESDSVFQHCRKLFDQLGLASFEKRKSIHTLRKNEKLLRELKNLDMQKCRETHKMAVIYVAAGQEDKISILSNSGGSEEFEEFVSGLGWEVELATHSGFLGGLQRNGSTGETAPYYATSLTEVIFHVSTRMPSNSEESSFQKIRHLGNDEVHVIWSEHDRDYRRGIIPTEFGDILIIIYPLANRMFRIHISTKPDVPLFGPLFDGAIVNRRILSKLVRSTAINASRAKRSRLPMYQQFYEERARSLETIVANHSEATTFEHFLSDVYCPVTGTSFSSTGVSRATGSSSVSSTLAAALIDRPSQSSPRPPLTRPTSYSVGEHHNVREKVRSALGHDSPGYGITDSSGGGSGRSSASPKGYKKHSFKAPRKMGMAIGTPTIAVQPGLGSNSVQQQLGAPQPPMSRLPPESPVPPPRKHKDTFPHSPKTK